MRQTVRGIIFCVLGVLIIFITGTAAAAGPQNIQGEIGTSNHFVPLFADVPTSYYNAIFINYLAELELVNGYPDGNFRPFAGLTRAEAAAILVRTADEAELPTAAPFVDVNPNHWAAGSITAAAGAGLVKGYPDGTFQPDAVLTRAEGLALFLRLARQPVAGAALPDLADIGPEHWAAPSVAVGLDAGMVELSQDQKHFLPAAPLTRGEMARILGILLTRDPYYYQIDLQGELKVNRGSVNLVKADGQAVTVRDTAEIAQGDSLNTGAGSEAEIIFPDGSGFLLQENTLLSIKEAIGRSYITGAGTAGTAVDWLALDLQQGIIFGALATQYEDAAGPGEALEAVASSNRMTRYPMLAAAGDEWMGQMFLLSANSTASGTQQDLPWYQQAQLKKVRVEVDMPWSVCAIRGTFWQNHVHRNGHSATNLFKGEGQVTAGGKRVDLTDGQRTEVKGANTPPSPPSAMSKEEKQKWIALARWILERARDIDSRIMDDEVTAALAKALVEANNGRIPDNIPPSLQQLIQNAISTGQPPSPGEGTGSSGTGSSEPLLKLTWDEQGNDFNARKFYSVAAGEEQEITFYAFPAAGVTLPDKIIFVLDWDNDSSIEVLEDTATRTEDGTWQVIGDTGPKYTVKVRFNEAGAYNLELHAITE